MWYAKRFLNRVLRWVTQTINVFCGPLFDAALYIEAKIYAKKYGEFPKVSWFGDEDEMTSSVLGKNLKWSWTCRYVCEYLDSIFKESDHCGRSIESDEGTK